MQSISVARGRAARGLAMAFAAATLWAGAATAQAPELVDIVAGSAHSCALDVDGRAWCWGRNSEGQLGDGTFETRLNPVRVQGIGRIEQLVAGAFHTCARTRAGLVRCWGWNGLGQLGDGSRSDSAMPVTVRRLGQIEILGVSAGYDFSCARNANGRVRCWGGNAFGQLGNGTNDTSELPVPVSNLRNVVGIASGGWSSCALIGNGRARCWGRNESFQLGDGTSIDRHTPVLLPGFRHGFTTPTGRDVGTAPQFGPPPPDAQFSIAPDFALSLNVLGRLMGAGSNESGQLGQDSGVGVLVRLARLGPVGVARVAAGEAHSCYIAARNGRIFCSGANNVGQLAGGFGAPFQSFGFIPAEGPGGFTGVAAGDWHTCAIRGGVGYCAGYGADGALGTGLLAEYPYFVPVVFPVD